MAEVKVSLDFDGNGEVTLTFGPLSVDDLPALIDHTFLPEFRERLSDEVGAALEAEQARREAAND